MSYGDGDVRQQFSLCFRAHEVGGLLTGFHPWADLGGGWWKALAAQTGVVLTGWWWTPGTGGGGASAAVGEHYVGGDQAARVSAQAAACS